MRYIATYLYSIVLVFLSAMQVYAQNWDVVGPNDTNKLIYTPSPRMTSAIRANGDIYVVFRDPLARNHLTVRKYDGSSWMTLGSRGFTDSTVADVGRPGIVVDKAGSVYVLFNDSMVTGRLTVARYDGASWSYVGARGFGFCKDIETKALALDTNDNVYVAFTDDSVGYKATLKKFDGVNWVAVGSTGFTAGSAHGVTLAIDKKTNVPFVVCSDNFYDDKAVVYKYASGSWLNIGGAISDSVVSNPVITIDTGGQPYVAYQDIKYAYRATVKKLSGSSIWTYVGTPGFTPSAIGSCSITTDSAGVPYVFYVQGSRSRVLKYNGASWPTMGDTLGCTANYPIITFAKGKVYAGFVNDTDFQYKVKYLSGTTWVSTNPGAISVSNASSYSLVDVDSAGIPYVVFEVNNVLTVKRFISGSWFDISPGMQVGDSYIRNFSFLADRKNNLLYIGYIDAATGKAAMIKYNGSAWANVGTGYCSDGPVREVTITLSKTGVPYIAFTDSLYSYKVVVKQFDGSSWVNAGSSGFSLPDPLYLSIAISDTLYIAYHAANNLVIEKLEGTTWQRKVDMVRAGHSFIASVLAATKKGKIYIAYSETGVYDSVSVQELVDTTLTDIGAFSFNGDANLSAFILDSADNPIVSVMTERFGVGSTATYYPPSVLRYSSGMWNSVGPLRITPGDGAMPDIAISNTGILYIAYNNCQLSVPYGGDVYVRSYNAGIPPDGVHNITHPLHRLSVYPSPCHNYCFLSGIQPNAAITIFDMSGRRMSSFRYTGNVINTSSLLPGIYYISTASGEFTRLVKQ